jgi:pre-mRNA cleavage complex 2 protein Pcf11
VSHGLNRPFPNQDQLLHGVENNDISKRNMHQLPNHPAGLISSNPQSSGQTPQLPFFPSQDPAASQFTYRPSFQGHGASISNPLSNVRPVMPLPLLGQRIANNPLHFQGGPLRPFPPAGPHAPPQMLPHPNPSPFVSSQQPSGGYSNLINSLMAQGVISLANQAPTQVTKSILSSILIFPRSFHFLFDCEPILYLLLYVCRILLALSLILIF